MNENNINFNVENETEEVKNPIYSSKFLMNKDLYYDFCCINYNKCKKIFLLFLCFVVCEIGLYLFCGSYDMVIGVCAFVIFFNTLIYFSIKKATKIGYERIVISQGEDTPMQHKLFEDKIVSNNDGLTREYSYNQITKFFETKKFLLLHLQHNLHLSIEKNNLNANVDEVKAFLINKCTRVKKKKFIKCSNNKKWATVFYLSLIIICVIGIIVGVELKSNSIF